MKDGFKKWFADFLEGSAILRGISKLTNAIYSKLSSGVYSFVFGSYDTMCETFDEGVICGEPQKTRGKICRFLTRSVEESFYVKAISDIMRYCSRLSMRVIGVFLMSAGIYTFAAQAVAYLLNPKVSVALEFLLSLIMFVSGMPMIFSKKSFCHAVSESLFFGGLVRGFCGFKDRSLKYDGEPTGRKDIAFFIGLLFGLLSYFISPLLMLLAMAAIIGLYIIMINSEFGYNLMIFMLPLLVVLPHPSILLAGLTLITFFSYVVKLIMGKRYFKAELLDVLVVCFMLAMMLGGIVSYGGGQSIRAASIYTVLILGYFLTTGLVNSKETLKRTVSILAASMFIVSAYGLYQNFSGNISAEWIDTEMFDSISGRVVSTFENPNMLGEYLILLLPMLAAILIGEKTMSKKTGYFLCFAFGAACLIFTWARGAWLGLIFGAAIFLLIWSKKSLGFMFAGVMALPFAIPFLPESIVSRFASIGNLADTSTNYRVYIWRGSANLASDYALTGIGVGEEAFGRVYPYYSFAGIETAPHAHNLFLQLFIELGLLGFVAFAAMLICFFQSGFSLAKCGEDKWVRLVGCGAMCGVFAALLQGMTDYIWYNYRVFFIFWIVIGIASAARRIDYSIRSQKSKPTGDTSVDITI